MTLHPAPVPTPDEIRALVAEVIRRLRTGGSPAPAAVVSAGTPAAASAVASGSAPRSTRIAERVIAVATIDRLPGGTARIVVDPRAVITPSARERLVDLGIAVDRGSASPAAAAVARPFLLARVDCPADAGVGAARIARALPGVQQLPATGLGDVIEALSVQASRDAARGLLLTGRPALAIVLANRSRSLRAVSGRDPGAMLAAARETAANLLVANPREWSPGALERVAVEFARLDAPLPSELAAAAGGCGCKSH
jgi:hypothetical protein